MYQEFMHLRRQFAALFVLACVSVPSAWAIGQTRYVLERNAPGAFPIVQSKTAAPIYADAADWPGVARAAADLQADIARVTGVTPALQRSGTLAGDAILIGTLGRSPIIDRLVREGKLDTAQVAGKWEAFVIQVVDRPLPGVARALVIAGSDKRGTIYGIYDVSEQIGVSPWYYWADVPVVHKNALFVKPGRYVEGEPSVKYRGIFLNDEAPALSGWVKEKFGLWTDGKTALMNHQFYSHVFELLLRLKANTLWPAMHAVSKPFNSFPEDAPLADAYAIVMGSSHAEPMLRNNVGGRRRDGRDGRCQTARQRLLATCASRCSR